MEMNTQKSPFRGMRAAVLAAVSAAIVPLVSGCGIGGIAATATAIGVAQVVDIASIPYRSLAGTIMLAIINGFNPV